MEFSEPSELAIHTRTGFVMFACSASRLGLPLCPRARRVRLTPNLHRRFCQSSLRTKARIACPPTQLRKFEGLSRRFFSCSFSFSKDPIDAIPESGSELFGRSSRDQWEADAPSSVPESSSELFNKSSRDLWEKADAHSSLSGNEENIATVFQESADHTFSFMSVIKFAPSTIESILQNIHVTTDLPWWLTIVACTVIVRTALIPLMLYAKKNSKRMSVIQPQLLEYREQSTAFYHAGDFTRVTEINRKVKALYKEHGVKPSLTVLPIICQLVLISSFFFAIRGMTGAPIESLATGGAMWFTDLTIPDPYYILPILNCTVLTTNISVSLADFFIKERGKKDLDFMV